MTEAIRVDFKNRIVIPSSAWERIVFLRSEKDAFHQELISICNQQQEIFNEAAILKNKMDALDQSRKLVERCFDHVIRELQKILETERS